jgi:predicted MFS family arabinose efflux permease
MGAGLYDAAFSTLGRYYGENARSTIATLTLFGGFASTVCWPVSAWLVETLGWRGACFAYAVLHLGAALPAYLFLLPGTDRLRSDPAVRQGSRPGQPTSLAGQRTAFPLLAAIIIIASAITSLMSVYVLEILQARGLELAAAVALGALIGPAQVGARAIEITLGRYYHPLWTMIAAMALMAAGLSLMTANLPLMAIPLVLYGAGIGIKSIARGTVPLALFGAADYPLVIGKLAFASLLAQAAAPFAGAFLMERGGPNTTLVVVAALSSIAVAVAIVLKALYRDVA